MIGPSNGFPSSTRTVVSRAAVLAAALAMFAIAVAVIGGATPSADAQTAASSLPTLAPAPTVVAAAGASITEPKGFTNSRAAALFFWFFAALTVLGSIFVITRRNMVTAVMGMVGTFFGIAALYTMLYAHFLAAIQILVYAGAIMVLFVFVIMIINRPEDDPWAMQGLVGKAIGALSLGYLVYRLASVLWTVKDQPHAAELPITPGGFEFGSTKAVGKVLFTDFLFPFEAISIVLLAAVVGAIAIARPAKPSDFVDSLGSDDDDAQDAEANS